MKYCSKCGKELRDEAVICVGCGCSVSDVSQNKTYQDEAGENPTLANLSFIMAFLVPIVGFVLGIIGMCNYTNPILRSRAKGGMLMSIAVFILCFTIICVYMQS